MEIINNTVCCKIKTVTEEQYIKKSITFNTDKNYELWFKFPICVENDLSDLANSIVTASIFPMMRVGGTFKICDAKITKSLKTNLEMFSKIWHIWCPNLYKHVELTGEIINDIIRPENNKIVTAFSGGLDGSYTTYKYSKDKNYDLDKCIMIHGADISINNTQDFSIAFNNARKMTNSLGIELLKVETNYREIFDINWEHCFGSVVAGTLGFFGKTYANGAAATDYAISALDLPWGINPVTDRYLANDSFRFNTDGYEHNRTQRADLIKDWKDGVENLRVCWQNEDKSKNCGKCEKCIRTKLNFKAVGLNHLPSMPNDFSVKQLDNIKIPHKYTLNYYIEIYDYAKEHNTLSKQELAALKKYINNWQLSLNIKRIKKGLKNAIHKVGKN